MDNEFKAIPDFEDYQVVASAKRLIAYFHNGLKIKIAAARFFVAGPDMDGKGSFIDMCLAYDVVRKTFVTEPQIHAVCANADCINNQNRIRLRRDAPCPKCGGNAFINRASLPDEAAIKSTVRRKILRETMIAVLNNHLSELSMDGYVLGTETNKREMKDDDRAALDRAMVELKAAKEAGDLSKADKLRNPDKEETDPEAN